MLVALLVSWGVAGRFWIETPNFKPIGAAALLAGWLLRDWRWAIAVPLLSLGISNWWLGGYELGVALAVYASTVIYSLLGVWGGRQTVRSTPSGLAYSCGLALAGSLQFFLLTNLAVWLWSGWYGFSGAEAMRCFVSAVPFYKWTLLADLLFFSSPLAVWYVVARPLCVQARVSGLFKQAALSQLRVDSRRR